MKKAVALMLGLLMVLAVACKAEAEIALSQSLDLTMDGTIGAGYILNTKTSMDLDGAPSALDFRGTANDSKWIYLCDVGVTWKNMIRPYVYLQGVSGISTMNEWRMSTQTMGFGADVFIMNTALGKPFVRLGWTEWKTRVDASIFGYDLVSEPKDETWQLFIGWKF